MHKEHGCSDVEHVPDCEQPGTCNVLCHAAATVPTADREVRQPAGSSNEHSASGYEGTESERSFVYLQ